VKAQNIDWRRLLADLSVRGCLDVARAISTPRGTLQRYLAGSQPSHWRGEKLLALSCQTTGRPRDEAPQRLVVPREVNENGADGARNCGQ
jgi:hypothetical protein